MTYRLMLKLHYETGINYLCITNRKNWKSYKGSGKRWGRLLNKIPSNIETFLIYENDDLQLFNFACRLYSEKLNVDNSWAFANLIPEIGYDKNAFSKLGAQRLKESGNRSGIYSQKWRELNKDIVIKNAIKGGKIGGSITGKMYWWNNGSINMRSLNSPGEGWVRGMLMSDKKRNQVYNQIAGHNRNKNVIKR